MQPNKFAWSETEEPHADRKKAILKAHPEIRQLFGPDPWIAVQVIGVVAAQIYVAKWVAESGCSNWTLAIVAYCIGGFATSNLFLANHELSHNLAFSTPWLNRFFGIVANIPIPVPFASGFQKYHLEHHKWQGHLGVDMDMASEFEIKTVKALGTLGKALWALLQLFFYALRPLVLRPKQFSMFDAANFAWVFMWTYGLSQYLGTRGMLYLLASVFMGGGLHPAGGHFISEHYLLTRVYRSETKAPQETFSYYGPLNLLAYNVGYHNEHHDFPRIPGSRLPQVRKIAPEFYDDLVPCKSWAMAVIQYIINPDVGPASRVARASTTQSRDGLKLYPNKL